MKKQKTITLKTEEEITLDSLTDREKMIYEAGVNKGAEQVGIWAMIGIIIIFVAVTLIG